MNSISLVSSKCAAAIQQSASKLQTLMGGVSRVALPAIALVVVMQLASTEAGPLTYASCMAGCAAMPPVCVGGGWAACLPLLGPFCP